VLDGPARGRPSWRWEGVDIDDPDAEPLPLVDDDVDEVAVERIIAGTLRPPRHARSPERIEAIRQLAGRAACPTSR
jgi:hypothetical protein